MFPSYVVPPEDVTEVLFAISQLDNNANREDIARFSDVSNRKARESIKVLNEIGIVIGDDKHTVELPYRDLIEKLPPDERGATIEEALLEYQPFVDYATYLTQGYSSEQASQMVFAANDGISNDAEYLQTYFERLGKYSGILTNEGDVSIEIREIPADSTHSIEKLRESLDSQLEIRVYLNNVLGDELMHFLDNDTKSDLADAYYKHSRDPRDSISATGRAFEDFLRHLGNQYGSEDRDYGSASGIVPLINHLQGDNLIKRIHKRRVFSLAEIRNKGGAHGDDAEVLERWDTSSEIALDSAITATLLIRSIYLYVSDDKLVL